MIPEALPLEPAHQAVQPSTTKPSLPAPLSALPSAVAEVKRFQQSEQRARELQRANVMQAFLEATSSQLTHHGLLSLQQVLPLRLVHMGLETATFIQSFAAHWSRPIKMMIGVEC